MGSMNGYGCGKEKLRSKRYFHDLVLRDRVSACPFPAAAWIDELHMQLALAGLHFLSADKAESGKQCRRPGLGDSPTNILRAMNRNKSERHGYCMGKKYTWKCSIW